jgi:hypothetical protein
MSHRAHQSKSTDATPTRRRARSAAAIATAAIAAGVVFGSLAPSSLAQELPSETLPAQVPPPETAAPPPPAEPGDYLEVVEVAPWVQPEGSWTAQFRPAQPLPEGATLTVSIRGVLTGDEAEVRAQLRDIEQGANPGPAVQDPDPWLLADLTTGGTVTLDVPIRSRAGSSDRLFLPNPGVHPVTVTIQSADGTELQELVLYLTRLPISTDRTPLQLGLWLPVPSGSTLTPDSEVIVPSDGRRAIERATTLLRRSQVPVNVAPDPALLDALATSDPDDREGLSEFSRSAADDVVLRMPWTAIDVEAWAQFGEPADVQSPVLAGQIALETRLATQVDGQVWADDPSVGPGSISVLAALGVQDVVADPGRVGPPIDSPETASSSEIFLLEGAGTSLPAVTLDPTLALMLGAEVMPPGEVAHRVLTEIQAIWFASGAATPAVVLPLDQRVPLANAQALVDSLGVGPSPTLTATSFTNLFARSTMATDAEGAPVRRPVLARESVPDVAPLSSFLEKMRIRVSAYHSTMAEEPDLTPLDHLLLGSQNRDLAEPQQRALIDEAARRVDADFAQIQPPSERSFTVTSRSATIPLQFTNGLDRPVRVHVNFAAPRLDFKEGDERSLVLEPGLNRIDLDVTARTSGQFNLAVETRTADQQVVLSRERLSIRSTAFSGVGLLLGGGAIAVIIVWWIRTLRRRDDASEDGQDATASVG